MQAAVVVILQHRAGWKIYIYIYIYRIHQRAGARQPQAAPFISFDLQHRVRCARQSRMMTNICNSGATHVESLLGKQEEYDITEVIREIHPGRRLFLILTGIKLKKK